MMINNLLLLNKYEEALPYIRGLLDMNPDNHNYHDLLLKITKSQDLPQFFDNLMKDYPTSSSVKLRRLHFLSGESFKSSFKEYITPYYEKGQPSLFSEIKGLYGIKGNQSLIEEVFLEMEQNSNNLKSPCSVLWSNMLLAQHFDFLQQHGKSLEYIEKVST